MTHLLTPDDVAERLAVSAKVVRQWLRDGKLPGIRLGRLWRVHPDALEKVLREGFRTPEKRRPRRKAQEARKARPKTRSTRKGKKRAPAKRTRSRGRK